MGRPSGPRGAFRMGFWYMLCSRMVGLMVGRLCRREQRSPWRQALRKMRCKEQGHERGQPRLAWAGIRLASACCACLPACLLRCKAPEPLLTTRSWPLKRTGICLPDFEVEGAVDAVLLGTEDAGQVVCHGGAGPLAAQAPAGSATAAGAAAMVRDVSSSRSGCAECRRCLLGSPLAAGGRWRRASVARPARRSPSAVKLGAQQTVPRHSRPPQLRNPAPGRCQLHVVLWSGQETRLWGPQGHRWLDRRYRRTLPRPGPNRRAQHVRHSPMGARLGLGVRIGWGLGCRSLQTSGGGLIAPLRRRSFERASPQSEGSPLQRPGHSWRGCAGWVA